MRDPREHAEHRADPEQPQRLDADRPPRARVVERGAEPAHRMRERQELAHPPREARARRAGRDRGTRPAARRAPRGATPSALRVQAHRAARRPRRRRPRRARCRREQRQPRPRLAARDAAGLGDDAEERSRSRRRARARRPPRARPSTTRAARATRARAAAGRSFPRRARPPRAGGEQQREKRHGERDPVRLDLRREQPASPLRLRLAQLDRMRGRLRAPYPFARARRAPCG